MSKIAKTAASLILTISLCAGVIAQTSPNSTPASDSPAASSATHELGHTKAPQRELTPDQTIAQLIADLKDLRELHEATKVERDAAVAALATEKAVSASLDRSYAAAEKQIDTLNRSISHLEKAISLHEKTIAMVEKQRDQAKAEAKRSRKVAVLSVLALAVKIIFF